MTKRIYLRGNLGDPRNLKIYDADTDKQLVDVIKIQITLDAAGVVQASLIRHNSPNVTVDVVAGPPAQLAGQTFYRVTLDADQRASHCDTIHVATVQSLAVDDDGTLNLGGKETSMHDAVSDQDLKFATNPRNELWDSADRALTGAIRVAIVKPKLDALLLPPQTGGVVSKPALGPKKATSCPECFDTGLTNGFMHPCSKGCTP